MEKKDVKIKDYIKKRWLLIITIIVFYVLTASSIVERFSFIPDYLNLSQVNPRDYFGLIIGAIASIFGILMAVIIITVEFFKERLQKNEHTNPLENKLIRNAIYNSVNLIGLSFISYILFENFQNSKSLTTGYFIGIIFITYIYSVFPVLKIMVANSSRIKENIDLTQTLDFDEFHKVSKNRYIQNPSESVLRKLKKEIDIYILNNNVTSYESVSNRIIDKSLE